MEIILNKRPKGCTLVEGFPGFGLIGTIASEFLVEHLDVQLIGKIAFDESTPMAAIHDGKIVQPMGIYHNKKHNIVFLHAIIPPTGYEWKVAKTIMTLAKQLQVKEIISLEGVGSSSGNDKARIFFHANSAAQIKKFKAMKINPLKEGIIVGVTGALLLLNEKVPIGAIFAETHSQLPDSNASARVVEVLDKYLGLKVDTKPLVAQAEQFEQKLKTLLSEGQKAQTISEKKQMNYVG